MAGILRARVPSHAQVLGSPDGGLIAASTIFASSLACVFVCFLASMLAIQAEPWRQPGETWSSGFLSGDTIRILESGEYLRASWCDICVPEYSSGTWQRDGSRIELHGEGGVKLLHRVTRSGCDLLVPEDLTDQPDAWVGLYAYEREGESCSIY